MSEKEAQLHHCEHCAAVFKAPKNSRMNVVCTECGQFPAATGGFVSRAQAETEITTDSKRGVAGKDVADFVSMQKLRRKKQMQMAVVLWALLLAAVPVGMYYFNGVTQGEVDEESVAKKEAMEKFSEAKSKAVPEALELLRNYDNCKSNTERVQYIVGDLAKIAKISDKMDDYAVVYHEEGSQDVYMEYFENGEHPRVEFKLKRDNGSFSERVAWKVEGEWKIDWEQHVRYSDDSFSRFLLEKPLGVTAEFRLYVRRRYSESVKQQELQLLFYQPTETVGDRVMSSPELVLSEEHPFHSALIAEFDALKNSDGRRIVGKEDPKGLVRVRATLSFKKSENGERQLQLDDIAAFHWMAFDPVKE